MSKQISFRLTILSAYFLLTAAMIVVIFTLMVYFDNKIVQSSIKEQFRSFSKKVESDFQGMATLNRNIIHITSIFEDVKKSYSEADQNRLNHILMELFKNNSKLYAAYIGYGDNSFYEIINLDIDSGLREKYNALSSDRWLLIKVVNERGKLLQYNELMDKNLTITSSVSAESKYYPTTRPWYKMAEKSDDVIVTEPYTFSNIDGKGITFAYNVKGSKNVLAVDVLINSIGQMLDNYKYTPSTKAFIFNDKGVVYASTSNAGEDTAAELEELISSCSDIQELSFKHYIKSLSSEKHFVNVSMLDTEVGGTTYLGIIAPFKEIMLSYIDRTIKIMLVCVFTLLCMLPVIWYLVSLIVKPISYLQTESDKVRERDFENIKEVDTVIFEISELSHSMFTMSKSIQDYQKNLEQKIDERTKELAAKNEELHKLSITDKLTGTYNRIHLENTFANELKRAERHGSPLSAIILDIDHFKSVNDTYGHQTGDSVLVEFSAILKNSVRSTDTVGRWGGEEFLIICPETGVENAAVLAEKIRKNINETEFTTVGHKTASMGVAGYRAGLKEKDIIANADEALYKSKQTGRNKVTTADA